MAYRIGRGNKGLIIKDNKKGLITRGIIRGKIIRAKYKTITLSHIIRHLFLSFLHHYCLPILNTNFLTEL